jgi:hypothetical protein
MPRLTFPTLEDSKRKVLASIALGVQEALRDKLTREHGFASGHLKGNINVKVEGDQIVITMPEYALPLEQGTPPHYIDYEELIDWAKDKFGKTDEESETIAFFVARNIKRFGTKPFPFIRTTFDKDVGNIIRTSLKRHFK